MKIINQIHKNMQLGIFWSNRNEMKRNETKRKRSWAYTLSASIRWDSRWRLRRWQHFTLTITGNTTNPPAIDENPKLIEWMRDSTILARQRTAPHRNVCFFFEFRTSKNEFLSTNRWFLDINYVLIEFNRFYRIKSSFQSHFQCPLFNSTARSYKCTMIQ